MIVQTLKSQYSCIRVLDSFFIVKVFFKIFMHILYIHQNNTNFKQWFKHSYYYTILKYGSSAMKNNHSSWGQHGQKNTTLRWITFSLQQNFKWTQ